MFTRLNGFLIAFLVVICISSIASKCVSQSKLPIHQEILNHFKSDVKSMYRAWHFIFGKNYEHDSIEGSNRFKIFEQNAKEIHEHNSKEDITWTKGFNHLSDMTNDEIRAHYGLKTISKQEIRKVFRNLKSFNLDDYEEDEDIIPDYTKDKKVQGDPNSFDYRKNMRPVRDQGSCGSCWAFATAATLEGQYEVSNKKKLKDWFSTQQLVDCDTGNHGCEGGWYNEAFKYFGIRKIMWEKEYPYTGVRGTCQYSDDDKKCSGLRITGFFEYDSSTHERFKLEYMFTKGPVAVAVDANEEWFKYNGGIYNGSCSGDVNHAVVLVGWVKKNGCEGPHWIIRNSWGEKWGEEGHIRILDEDSNNLSCNVEKYAYSASGWR